jgi:hypothetical protein
MSVLVLNSNQATNPQTLDLTSYMMVNDGDGLDPANNEFSSKVWGHSLLKAGATLALENEVQKEQVFPLLLGPVGGVAGAPTNLSQTLQLIQKINALLRTLGATLVWQPLGTANATTFDLLSGQVDISYSYRKEGQFWTEVTMRAFTQPFGRTAGPRVYAAASGVGPLLLVSPYASNGALAIVASSAGYGASGGVYGPNGASGGVSYAGNPSLAGDAPAQLQVTFAGPLAPGAQEPAGLPPFAAVSVLPDHNYTPLIPRPELGLLYLTGSQHVQSDARAVASSYWSFAPSSGGYLRFYPPNLNPGGLASPTPLSWAGQHRLLAIARASVQPGYLATSPNSVVSYATGATVYPGDWGLWDLGTFTLRASETIADYITTQIVSGQSCTLDVTAMITLPDNNTWFFNPITPGLIAASDVGNLAGTVGNGVAIDDWVGDQFLIGGGSFIGYVPPPAQIGTLNSGIRITQYTRGLVPQPDPRNGFPIIAIVAVGQQYVQANGQGASAAWANPQNLPLYAQVSVLERYRYVSS